jgi:hypothetical protein
MKYVDVASKSQDGDREVAPWAHVSFDSSDYFHTQIEQVIMPVDRCGEP